jgi:hypothetical protein
MFNFHNSRAYYISENCNVHIVTVTVSQCSTNWAFELGGAYCLTLNFQCHVQGFLHVETFHWIILQIIYRTCDILYLIYSEGACQFKARPCGLAWILTRPFTVKSCCPGLMGCYSYHIFFLHSSKFFLSIYESFDEFL